MTKGLKTVSALTAFGMFVGPPLVQYAEKGPIPHHSPAEDVIAITATGTSTDADQGPSHVVANTILGGEIEVPRFNSVPVVMMGTMNDPENDWS